MIPYFRVGSFDTSTDPPSFVPDPTTATAKLEPLLDYLLVDERLENPDPTFELRWLDHQGGKVIKVEQLPANQVKKNVTKIFDNTRIYEWTAKVPAGSAQVVIQVKEGASVLRADAH